MSVAVIVVVDDD